MDTDKENFKERLNRYHTKGVNTVDASNELYTEWAATYDKVCNNE